MFHVRTIENISSCENWATNNAYTRLGMNENSQVEFRYDLTNLVNFQTSIFWKTRPWTKGLQLIFECRIITLYVTFYMLITILQCTTFQVMAVCLEIDEELIINNEANKILAFRI